MERERTPAGRAVPARAEVHEKAPPGPAQGQPAPPAATLDTGAEARAAAARARAAAAERASEARATAAAHKSASRLDDARVQELHRALVAERRRLHQPGKVSVDALASSLRETENKLRQQYSGKKIDFHVVVKNGKAVVKPIVE